MATTAAADDTVPTLHIDEAFDEARRTKPFVMLGRDRPVDGPSVTTVRLLGEPLDLSVSMVVIEPYSNGGGGHYRKVLQ